MVKKTMNSLFLNYLLQSKDNIEANVEKWTKDFNIAENIDEISETLNEHMVYIMLPSLSITANLITVLTIQIKT